MDKLPNFFLSQIKALEEKRQSSVLVFAASNLEIELLPNLYETLLDMGQVQRLDVVLYCRGGIVNAARRIALLLHEFTEHLSFLVPHHCESSSTLLVLSAHEIIPGPLAIFSPIDPCLQASDHANEDSPSALSAQDVRLFSQMSKDWFGLKEQEAKVQSLSLLCNSIFPTTLTSFYRSTLELQEIGEELLALQLPEKSKQTRTKIIEQLLFDYHSHTYALTGNDLAQLGLKITRQAAVEKLIWEIGCKLRSVLGAGVRQSIQSGWFDAIIVTRNKAKLRYREKTAPQSVWKTSEFAT